MEKGVNFIDIQVQYQHYQHNRQERNNSKKSSMLVSRASLSSESSRNIPPKLSVPFSFLSNKSGKIKDNAEIDKQKRCTNKALFENRKLFLLIMRRSTILLFDVCSMMVLRVGNRQIFFV